MEGSCPRIVIAALRGGSGKTILSAGLCSFWKRKGRSIVPFKKGPDFIDAGWLAIAAGHPCFNLDLFLMEKKTILASFLRRTEGMDGALIEGNRGIFDGLGTDGFCSTAELAKVLKAPVILVVDVQKTTRTAAAMVMGCLNFDPDLDLRGVILNQVAGERHEAVIRGSIEEHCGIPVLGSIPRINGLSFHERHMGLVPPQEHPSSPQAIEASLRAVKDHVEGEQIWKIASLAIPMGYALKKEKELPMSSSIRPKIGVIRDSAFQFYYPENLEEISKHGAELEEISALNFSELPDVDALYIGGGFPETHAGLLAGNLGFRRSIKERAMEGLPIYAECGGLIYLGERLVVSGISYPMAGVIPATFCIEKRPQGHGYSCVEVDRPNPFFDEGFTFRGHEFHYSRVIDWKRDIVQLAFRMKRGQGFTEGRDGLCIKNVLATYTHIHALGTPEWAKALLRKAIAYRQKRGNSEKGSTH